jgi:hypothetical protein
LAKRHHDRRRDERTRDAVLLVHRRNCSRSKRGSVTIVAPGPQPAVHHHLHAVDVEERQDRDEGLTVLEVGRRERLGDVGDQVAVGEHHALRQARGARRVGQHHRVVGQVDRDLLGQRLAEQVAEVLGALGRVDRDDLLDLGALGRRAGRLEEHPDRDQDGGPGVLQLVLHLLGAYVGLIVVTVDIAASHAWRTG